MAKAPTKPTNAERLSQAVEALRAKRPTKVVVDALTTKPVTTSRPAKRVIKYPNNSGALRQHVEETRKSGITSPLFQLRLTEPEKAIEQGVKTVIPRRAEAVVPPTTEELRASATEKLAWARVARTRTMTSAEELKPIKTVLALGDAVRHARRRYDLTQGELAAAAGTGRRFISDLEAGKPTIEFERLLKVCKVLGIDVFASEAGR